jgi:hypothetical protein
MHLDLFKKYLISPSGALLFMLALILLRAEGTWAQKPPDCATEFKFAQTETVALEWRQGSEQRVEVLSSDGKPRDVKVSISDIGLTGADGKSVPADIIEVSPRSGTLKNGIMQIILRVVSTPDVKPGTYTGHIILNAEQAKSNVCPVLRQVRVVVPDATPLVDKLTVWASRPFFFMNYECDDCAIPLKRPLAEGTTALQKGEVLGGVKKDSGGTGVVYWSGLDATSPGATPGLRFTVAELKEAGKYEGKIALDAAAGDKGTVTLTVNATDFFIWPVTVIALGVILATITKTYVGILRIRWRLREQEAGTGIRFKESQSHFDEVALPHDYRTYTIADAFAKKRQELRNSIDNLKPSSGMALDESDPEYKSVVAGLAALKEHADNWARLADELERLRQMTGRETGPSPVALLASVPKLISQGRSLLSGKELSLEEFISLREEIPIKMENARLWFRVNDRINEHDKLLARVRANISKLSEQQKGQVEQAAQALNTARIQLWLAETKEDVDNITMQGNPLSTTEQTILSLASAVSAPAADVEKATSLARAFQPRKAGEAMPHERTMGDVLGSEPADDDARREFYAKAINRWDCILALIAFALALLTGLHNSYFGQAFGTLKDYAGLLLWAVGTKVVVDTFSVTLGWLFNRLSGKGI